MSQISFEDLVNGTVPDASDFNSRLNALKNRINTGMEADNIAANAVTTAKINSKAVTLAKVADGTLGGLPYYGTAGAATELAGNTTTTQKFLAQTGSGSASAAPSWVTILTPALYTDTPDTNSEDDTTDQTSYQDTALSITATVGKQGLAFASFSGRGDSSSGIALVALVVDGTVVREVTIPSGQVGLPISMFWHGVLSAASHTVKIQIKGTGGGDCTLKGSVTTSRLGFSYPT